MATYTLGPTTVKQDQMLAYVATKRGISVDELVNGEMARILNRARNEFEQDDAAKVAEAYTAATAAKQQQVRTALGLP
jgi:hypothetical protein